MTVYVSFIETRGLGGVIAAPAVGDCRVTETVALDGTSTATAGQKETALITNTGSDTVLITHGKTPDASATSRTSATNAGYPLLGSASIVVATETGDKINVKAIA